jgi:choloylglycine hydrolase
MIRNARKNRFLASALISCAMIATQAVPVANACTTLMYQDLEGRFYAGRTLELSMELPYEVTFIPKGSQYVSKAGDTGAGLSYTTKHQILAITVPDVNPKDLKVLEGMNDKGLTFSLLAFAGTSGPKESFDKTKAALAAIDLGSWTLGQFANVDEVKTALSQQPVLLTPLAALGGADTPFHYVLHDKSGASIVIEFANNKQTVYDNPVGVMTNAPTFQWHLTNLNNYTFFSNIDKSTNKFGSLSVSQPDSGIATVALPASNTSVGRFVRAVYYSHFAQKVSDRDEATRTLAHIMNNFDRPKDITIDMGAGGSEGVAKSGESSGPFTSEYTSWTALHDIDRGTLYLRTYKDMNYKKFDLNELAKSDKVLSIPLSAIDGMAGDSTGKLLAEM